MVSVEHWKNWLHRVAHALTMGTYRDRAASPSERPWKVWKRGV